VWGRRGWPGQVGKWPSGKASTLYVHILVLDHLTHPSVDEAILACFGMMYIKNRFICYFSPSYDQIYHTISIFVAKLMASPLCITHLVVIIIF